MSNTRPTVEAGYDQMAEQYLASKDLCDPTLLDALSALSAYLGPTCVALDLGCGAGVPATQWLAQRCEATGVDLSARQLALARANVPGATLIHASMSEAHSPTASFDVVPAFYAIIHVPREEQAALLRRIWEWLTPGGLFLTTWSINGWEGIEQDWQGWGIKEHGGVGHVGRLLYSSQRNAGCCRRFALGRKPTVCTAPGDTTLAVMPTGASSLAAVRP